MQYILARLSESSTWRGIIMVLGGIFGFALAPELTDSIVVIMVAIFGSGVVGVITPDKQ